MTISKRIYTLVAITILCAMNAKAQDKPIGYWRSHLPYNNAIGVVAHSGELYTICNAAFFTFSPLVSGAQQEYSKSEGMSDLGMQCIGFDASTETAILAYADGNIDLFKNNTFYNIPDLKIKTVAGSKTIYSIYTENGMAYLSTSLGVLVIDLANYNITETYQFLNSNQTIPVTSFIGYGSYYYVTTPKGLFRASKNNPELQNFQVWQKTDTTVYLNSAVVDDTLFLSGSTQLYAMINDTMHSVYTSATTIQHIDSGSNNLLICEFNPATVRGDLKVINTNYQITDSFYCFDPLQALAFTDGSIWVADGLNGLSKLADGKQTLYFTPPGPNNVNSFDIYARNKDIWVAHGGYSDKYIPNGWGFGMSNYVNGSWVYYRQYSYAPFNDTVADIVAITKDEKDGTVYAGSMSDGLFTLKQNGDYQVLKQNSIFDSSTSIYGSGQRQVIGVAIDQSDNLWVTTAFSQHHLYVKTPDSNWYKFSIPGLPSANPSAGPIAIDGNGQIWFAGLGGSGVVVYNTNGTVADPSDDASYVLTTGVGFGNLPSNNVFCIANDKNNNIWVGTDNGIGIVSNCNPKNTASQTAPCDAQIPIVQYDQFAGYLFAGNNVRTIAVDGANRKWVGTDNGVWLLSSDASKIIYRFTIDNSPLPSNNIVKIAVDGVTGDVYFGTDQGLVSYHSTATDGGTSNQNVLVFPDPVPSGYQGTIAIKGLVANADVRITDIGGQLVYRTTALGGQAVWNGLDYKGHRPETGVYLIFVSSSDGSQTYEGKIMFLK